MSKMIFIVGAGGCAREVLNIYTDLGKENEVDGFIEENCHRQGEIINGKPIYDISSLENYDVEDCRLVCGIGTPLRKRLIEKTKNMGFEYETLIHPNVIMSRWVEIGEGCIICAGTILTNQIKIGDHSIINYGCTIGHDVTIGSYTTLSPGVHISGNVSIGDCCFIGVGAVTVEKLNVGKNTFIGAGAVVTKDIAENVLAMGVPAKPIQRLEISNWKEII